MRLCEACGARTLFALVEDYLMIWYVVGKPFFIAAGGSRGSWAGKTAAPARGYQRGAFQVLNFILSILHNRTRDNPDTFPLAITVNCREWQRRGRLDRSRFRKVLLMN